VAPSRGGRRCDGGALDAGSAGDRSSRAGRDAAAPSCEQSPRSAHDRASSGIYGGRRAIRRWSPPCLPKPGHPRRRRQHRARHKCCSDC
jgi:hypothetical protein